MNNEKDNFIEKNQIPVNIDPLYILREKGHLYKSVLDNFEKPLIEKVLELTAGNKSRAAKILGINRNTLDAKIKKAGIDVKKYKNI